MGCVDGISYGGKRSISRCAGIDVSAMANPMLEGAAYTYRKTCFSPRGRVKRFGRRGRRGNGEGFLKKPGLGLTTAEAAVFTAFMVGL